MLRALIFFTVSLILSYVFFASGSNKLFPIIPAAHEFLVEGAKAYPEVFTMLPFDADTFRVLLGVSQVICAFLLFGNAIGVVGNCISFLATVVLMVEMGCAAYFHHVTETDAKPVYALLALLFCRMLFRKRCC